MEILKLLKPSFIKIVITGLLIVVIYLYGILVFNQQIFFGSSCHSRIPKNTNNLRLEVVCNRPSLPFGIQIYSLPLIFLLYFITCFTVRFHRLSYILIYLFVSLILGYFYFTIWRSHCGHTLYINLKDRRFDRYSELKCPDPRNPFNWSKFKRQFFQP